MRKFTLLATFAVLFAGATRAQIPDTPAGRQFSAWLTAFNSGDRAVMQQFFDKSMTFGRIDQDMTIRNQTGGFDVKKVEESTDTRVVVLAQERAPTRQFTRIAMSVEAAEPHQVAGLRFQPAQPPPDLTPPKMTASEDAAARKGAPFRQFSAWLAAFNSGDRTRIGQFLEANYPSMKLDAQMNFRERTGGFELRALEQATATSLTGLVQEHGSDQFGRFILVVEPDEPNRITRFGISAIPRPAEFPIPRMNEAELIAALRAQVEKDAAADRFAGTVLLAKNGKVVFSQAYGLADREKKVPNQLDTRFRIGSMNKMFTAVSVLQLVQAGKIKLTDPLGKYITDYSNQDVAAKVTIHHLLTHTGGTGDIFGPDYNAHRLELRTLNDYVSLYGKRAPAFEPGSQWAYSNYGMVLLGVVVERLSKQSYYDYVAEHVYKPAGMTLTGSEPESETVRGRAIGYMRGQGGGAWTPNTDTLPYRGTSAGGGYSTVGDLMKFADALMGHKLLNPEYTELLFTGKVDSGGGRKYAYGFEDGRKDGAGAVGHGGGAPGMNGDLRIYPQSGYVVAVLSNLDPPAAQQVSAFLDLRLPKMK
jgi:D-alanyl-D-alanine carboxypeptidase